VHEKVDLHCHSISSDGELTPHELLELAAERGITHLALTDHDTLDGLPAAALAAQEHDICLIPGVELSCSWRGQLLHIVGLGVNPECAELKQGIAENQQRRWQRAERMIEDFLNHDIDLGKTVSGLLGDAVPTRPHFAQALIKLGYAKDKKQAFKRFLVRGKPGYIPLIWPDLTEIGRWIKAAGGIAVLAHPMRYNMTRTKLVALIEEMKAADIVGIEVSTPVNDANQIQMLAQLAREHKLLGSMGSDFHSPDQPWARLGTAQPLPSGVQPVWQAL